MGGRYTRFPAFYPARPARFSMGRINEILSLAQSRARELKLPYEGALTPWRGHELLQLDAPTRG
jgi:hypothetical protein